jgi:hypothetical protein
MFAPHGMETSINAPTKPVYFCSEFSFFFFADTICQAYLTFSLMGCGTKAGPRKGIDFGQANSANNSSGLGGVLHKSGSASHPLSFRLTLYFAVSRNAVASDDFGLPNKS